ncbi:cysteine-rich CWC family protein [Pseudomonas sp. DSP3-2-2]|uniref:cysteine-rich CWC family protein n=1 Tax=unclassified Pseudomonas TaxID=196821 RepID=UPI003CEE04F1
MSTSSVDTDRCPACGSSNRCSLADPRTVDQACWCFSVEIDPAVIEALPPEVRAKACLCPRCAGVENAAADKSAS